jgi:peptidoglycan-N-acetylglucosamine deacetylase
MCRMKRTILVTCLTIAAALPLAAARHSRSAPLALWGFTGPWDPRSAHSVRQYASKLDVLVTGWIALDSATARPIVPALYPDTLRVSARGVSRFAIVTSWHGQHFHPATIRRLAANATLLELAASTIAQYAAAQRYGGLVLDFEGLERGDVESLVRVSRAIATAARQRGVKHVVMAVPASDTAAYPARRLLEAADLVLVMLYDQHWSTSAPGAISDPAWARQALALRVAEVGADHLVAGFPTYGYRWIRGQPTELLSYADARRIAASTGASLSRDRETSTLTASRPNEWELWVTDATLLQSLLREASRAGLKRASLWRLGQEDSTFWTMIH